MANDLVPVNSSLATLSEQELLEVIENSIFPGAQLASIKLALLYCKGGNLDILQKPIHIVPMSVKVKLPDGKEEYVKRDVLMPGINRHRVQAAESGGYAGQSESEFGPMKELIVPLESGNGPLPGFEYPEWCKVTVYRIVGGEARPFTAIAYWLENYTTKGKDSLVPNDMWRKRPRGQLEKCAEAQALRKAFPERAGGQTAEEMAGKVINDADTIEGTAVERREPREPQRKSAGPAPAPAAASPAPAPAHAPAGAGRSTGAMEDMTGEKKWIETKCKQRGLDLVPFLKQHGLESLDQLTPDIFAVIQPELLRAKEAA